MRIAARSGAVEQVSASRYAGIGSTNLYNAWRENEPWQAAHDENAVMRTYHLLGIRTGYSNRIGEWINPTVTNLCGTSSPRTALPKLV